MLNEDKMIVLQTGDDFLMPAASLEQVLATYQRKKEFIEKVLREGVDFGVTPGTSDKPSLKKPGAEKMASFFGLTPTFEDVVTIEDWTGADHGGEPFFYYRQKIKLWRGDRLIASADGSCNSWEKKYRYRNADRVCPNCGKATIFKSKNNPEFYCWNKKGGCGVTFPLTDERITKQETGQVKNPDVAELTNTILKMAQKRTLVAGVLIATNASDYFSQDLDDFVTGEIVDGSAKEPARQATGNPDPIDDKTWDFWLALCHRAEKFNISYTLVDREKTTKSDLRAGYEELSAFVSDAKAQAQTPIIHEPVTEVSLGSITPDEANQEDTPERRAELRTEFSKKFNAAIKVVDAKSLPGIDGKMTAKEISKAIAGIDAARAQKQAA